MEERPNGLTVVGFVCLGAGMLSACCNLWGLVGTVGQLAIGASLGAQHLDGDSSAMMALQRESAIYTAIPALLGVAVALVLVAGGGLALSMKPAGRPLLLGALGAAIFVAFVETAVSGFLSYRMSSVLEHASGGGAPGDFGGFGMTGVLVGASVGMGVLWLVVKLGVYVPCLVYMLRGETAAYFARRTQMSPRGD